MSHVSIVLIRRITLHTFMQPGPGRNIEKSFIHFSSSGIYVIVFILLLFLSYRSLFYRESVFICFFFHFSLNTFREIICEVVYTSLAINEIKHKSHNTINISITYFAFCDFIPIFITKQKKQTRAINKNLIFVSHFVNYLFFTFWEFSFRIFGIFVSHFGNFRFAF